MGVASSSWKKNGTRPEHSVWEGSEKHGPYLLHQNHQGLWIVTGPGIFSYRWFTDKERAVDFITEERARLFAKEQESALVAQIIRDNRTNQFAGEMQASITPRPNLKPKSPKQEVGYEVKRSGIGWEVTAWWGKFSWERARAWRLFNRWAHYKGSAMLLRGLEEPDRFEITIERKS